MSFKAGDQTGGGDFTPQDALAAGTYPGRLVQIVTMGLQPQRAYQGQPKEAKESMYVGYELSHEFMVDDDGNPDPTKPRWMGEDFPFYNLDADRAKSTLRYTAIDPSVECGGDWEKILSWPCNITLSKELKKGKKDQYTNYVTHVAPAANMPGYVQPELVNEVRMFDIETPNMEVFKLLPKWLREKLTTNLNYNGSALQAAMGDTATAAEPAPAQAAPQTAAPPAPPAPTPPPAPAS